MAGPRFTSDVLFCRLSKSGHGYVVTVPASFRQTLGWFHGATLELWIDGDTLMVHRAIRTRDVGGDDRPPEGRGQAGPGGKVDP